MEFPVGGSLERATPPLVQCETCGEPYSACLVGGEFVLATNDGRCACGSRIFVTVEGTAEPRADTVEGETAR